MSRSDVWFLYRRELRSALRERSVVVNSILMPLFLYPVMMFVMFTGMMFVMGLVEGSESRVVVMDPPPAHGAIMDTLRARENIDVRDEPLTVDSAVALISAGKLDALVRFEPPDSDASALPDNFEVVIHYDRAVDRSRRARDRVEGVIDDYRAALVDREASSLGIRRIDRARFRITSVNVATGRQMGALMMSVMIPMFLVIMVALGCFVPSIDSTAGERERSTWETLMTVSASRRSIVTAKYLYVATLGITAGLLNVTAVFVSLGAVIGPLLAGAGAAGEAFEFRIQPLAWPVMLGASVVLALFFASAMMILAAFARTFKDGQAMVTPVYWLAIVPILLGQQTDRTLTPALAAIPIANVAAMIRDAINGVFLWPLIAEVFAVQLVLVAGCLVLARWVLRFEDFLLGSFDGSFWRFAKQHISSRSAG